MPGIEPGAFHMQSERSTTEPHPHIYLAGNWMKFLVDFSLANVSTPDLTDCVSAGF